MILNVLPLARYYVPSQYRGATLLLEGKAGLALTSFDGFDEPKKETAFQFAVGPGVAFSVSDDITVDVLLAYKHITGNLE